MQKLRPSPVRHEERNRFARTRLALLDASATCWAYVSERFLLRRPVVCIITTVGVCLALSSRLVNIDVVYSPRNTLGTGYKDSRQDESYVEQLFPSTPRFSHLFFTALGPDNGSYGDDTNVLSKTLIDKVWEVAEQVSLIEAGPENERYETLCYRHSTTGQCAPYGVLSFWDGDEALYRLAVADDASLRIELSAETFLDGTPVPRDLVFGDYILANDEASDEEVLKYARGVMVTYALRETPGNTATIVEWEKGFLQLAAEVNLVSYRMMWQAGMSSYAEQRAGVQGWGCGVVAVVIVAIATTSSFLLGDLPRWWMPSTHTRLSLGLVGVAFLMLSTTAAGGTLAMSGVALSGVHATFVALVCVVVGLKNMFGLCVALDDALRDMPARHRARDAALRWAPGALLVATLSFMIMVVGAAMFSSSATRNFCAYAGAGILLGWVTQVFGLIPCLLIDERRRDTGRLDLACCLKQSAHFGGNNDGPPRLHRRRDSFVVEHSLDFHHPSAGSGESLAQDTLWNDTGDELTPTRPCSPSSGNTNMAGRKTMFPRPSPGSNGLREACSRATEAERSDRHDKAPVLHGIPNRHVRKKSEVIEGQTRRGGGISPHRCVTPKRCQPFLPDLNRDTFGGGAKGRPSRWGLQKPVLVNGERETSFERGSFKRAEHREVGGFLGGRHGGNGSREECRGEALVQGCCNWLLAGNVAKWGVLSAFGVILCASIAVCLVHGSPGYDVNDFYPRSSYLYDFVATTRRQGILLGESSLPVAVYIQSAYLFKPATQQAVLDLETALVSSSPFTVDSTSSLHRGDIIRGNGPSSWLRGFIGWLPSSPYASAVAESGSQAGLWNGTAELFASAVNVFVAESGNTRFEGDLWFEDGIPAGCRIWARHVNFTGRNAVTAMESAKHAVGTFGRELDAFVFATEYIYAEHYLSVTREMIFYFVAAAVCTSAVGYLFLGNVTLTCILSSVAFAVQVEALAMIILLDAGDSGINAFTISPSFVLAAALGVGSVGSMLKTFSSQDCGRSLHANIRISIVETSGSAISTSVVLAIGVLPLLVFSISSPSATHFVQTVASSTLWAVLLSLTHGLLLAPTLLLVCGENLAMQPRSVPNLLAATLEAETFPWRLRRAHTDGHNIEVFGNGYSFAASFAGAVAVLDDQDIVRSKRGDQNLKPVNQDNKECTNSGSPSVPDLVPGIDVAAQKIGARTAMQTAPALTGAATLVMKRGGEKLQRIRGASWADVD